ncbi:thioesterase family protein [Thalassotalea ponticola]|uniref:acyl-CoA thioesterase n=1 Tax=Thalassotalea ponticola TaxID=1523392 RepID=UPI0025B2D7BF|nr:thioesterase family protein [Thalassotalea ponticola]MDN3651937.1 thioesterase family protein [Thalassotalea ponticola]
MHIDVILNDVKQQLCNGNSSAVVKIDKSWTQGRTVFGGLSAAITYQAIAAHLTGDRLLRSLSTSFVGPIKAGVDICIEVEVLRSGKNVTQVMAKAVQDNSVCLTCLASFGVERASKIVVQSKDSHPHNAPKKANFIPQIPKIVPNFLRHFDLALVEGKMPFRASEQSNLFGWMRFSKAPNAVTDAHLVALIDSWPPAVLQMLRWPAPASSLSWNLEFIHPHRTFACDAWFAYQVNTRQAADGYAHTEANIWDQNGDLIAISRQVVTVFDG